MTKTINIPVGPVHPALKEPTRLTLELDGEKVVNADYEMGFAHRGIEWAGMRQNPVKTIYLSERICGICAFCHPWSFVQAIEEIGNIEVPERAEYIRIITAELERIHSHTLWAGVAAHEIGFDSLLHLTWKARENVMDMMEILTGNRVTYGMLMVGGVRRDITESVSKRIMESVEYYRGLVDKIGEVFLSDPTVQARANGVGVLPRKKALDLVALGPTARASGINKDVRQDWAFSAYPELGVRAIMPESANGDVADRIYVRVQELAQSADIIEQCLGRMPAGEILAEKNITKLLFDMQKLQGESVGMNEAPRGEVFHYVRMDGKEAPISWKVRAPTYNNVVSWPQMLIGEELADVPIIAASIDPCMSCTDRVTATSKGKSSVLTADDLHRLSVQKSRRLVA